MNKYLESLKDDAIDYMEEQIDLWQKAGVAINRDNVDKALDQYYDDITGNNCGATPTRIYQADAEAFYSANADPVALRQFMEESDSADIMLRAYTEGDYNTLDVLESIRVFDECRDAIVDAVCKHYGITE